ncbi:methionyl-tRNA formyltransferase [Flavitalea antarctica]
MRIVFMGTPDFAVASLEALVNAGFEIAGVVTAPDKPAGRGLKLTESAVKTYAVSQGIPVLQPEKLKSPDFLDSLTRLKADIQVVVAFRMLPELVWNMPPLGTINVHGSLLPKYRGAAPINWAVINGEKETGVTTFKLQHAIDTGNILLQEKMTIGEHETAGEIHDRMKMLGAGLLVKTLKGIADNTITESPQPTAENVPHAPKIFTETCRIDWNNDMNSVYNLIRGLSPYPGAFTMLDGKTLKIFRAKKEAGNHKQQPGELQTDEKSYLKFATPDGLILVEELQLEGKKKMSTGEFLRGYRFKN